MGNTLKKTNSIGVRTPLVISLKDLLAIGEKNKIKQYEFEYYNGNTLRQVLFYLKIE